MLKNLSSKKNLNNNLLASGGPSSFPMNNKKVYELNYSDYQALKKQRVKQKHAETWRFPLDVFGNSVAIVKIRAKIKQFKAPKRFSLDCFTVISSKGFVSIGQYFKEFIVLQSLRINFSPYYRISNNSLCHLSEGLKRFSSLKSLDIRFSHSATTDESLDILRKGFRKHISLKKVILTFARCQKITDEGIKNLCKDLKNLVFLQSLTLDFYACGSLTDESLFSMKKLLEKLRNLKQVNLDFRYCQKISLFGAEKIIEGFENSLDLPKTIIFKFVGSECSIGVSEKKEGLKSNIFFLVDFSLMHKTAQFNVFKQLLRKKTHLRDLDFVLESFHDIDNRVLKNIRQTFENLASVQTINLQFPRYNLIDEKLLKSIMQFFKGLRRVNHMKLEFFRENLIPDKGAQSLSKGLEDHRYLEKLEIKLSHCNLITDKGLEKLGQSLRKMIFLQNLNLNFSGCDQIGDKGMQCLVESLKKCVVLQEVTLKFDLNGRITNVGRDQIIEILKRHGSLKTANIDFGNGFQTVEVLRDRNDQVQNDEEVEYRLVFLLFRGVGNLFKRISTSLFQCCYDVHTE